MQYRNFIHALGLALSVSILCGSTQPVAAAQGQTPKFAYTIDMKKVHGFNVNPSTGVLTPVAQKPQWAHDGAVRLAGDRGGYRLYVVNSKSKDLVAYFINRKNGSLARTPGMPFPIGNRPLGVVVAPSGKYVFVIASLNFVYSFAVQPDGSLAGVPGSPFLTNGYPDAVTVDPTGRFLYVSESYASKVDAYAISAGVLTPVPGSPFPQAAGTGAVDLAINPSGTFLFAPQLGHLTVFRIDQTSGGLAQVSGSPFPYSQSSDGYAVAVDPFEQYVYVNMEGCSGTCMAETLIWSLDKNTGSLNFLSENMGGCGGNIIRPDPSGKFLYEIGSDTGNVCGGPNTGIWGLSLDRNSATLQNIPGSPFIFMSGPQYWTTSGLVVTP
jgi:DNA-binding beta-propeller fold protein YncE